MHGVGDLVTLATAFMMTVSGFVEVVSRAMLRDQMVSELFSKGCNLTSARSELAGASGRGGRHALAGRRDEALKIIGELNKLSEHKHVSPTAIAAISGALGDKDQAFALLNKAFDERDFVLITLKVEPMLDPLRSDPRFAELARRIGLPE